jgi:hypothetical protein
MLIIKQRRKRMIKLDGNYTEEEKSDVFIKEMYLKKEFNYAKAK